MTPETQENEKPGQPDTKIEGFQVDIVTWKTVSPSGNYDADVEYDMSDEIPLTGWDATEDEVGILSQVLVNMFYTYNAEHRWELTPVQRMVFDRAWNGASELYKNWGPDPKLDEMNPANKE